MKHLRERILALGMALCLCLSLCAVPASAAVDETKMPKEGTYGPITLSLALEKLGSNYTATYTAKTTMVDWLAQAAAVCKDDPSMKDLRFTCTLYSLLVTKLSGGIDEISYDFTSAKFPDDDGKELFVLVDGDEAAQAVTVLGGSLKLRYKLNPEVLESDAWKVAETEAVKKALQKQMRMTATEGAPASTLADLNSTIITTAWIDISMLSDESDIPFYKTTEIEAAYGVCEVENPEHSGGGGDSGSTGGGGGSVTPTKPTIEIKDNTPSVDTPSDIPVGGGTTTVENPNAKPGEEVRIKTDSDPGSMVNYISVKDEDGKRIPVTYDGKGKFTFEMPESGKVTIEANYRVIPANPKETGVAELLNTNDHILYMIGDDKGDFRPNASISRAEVATAFFRLLLDQNVEITQHFGDVKTTDWYVQPIETLASLHIIEGVGSGDYQPNRAITRAEFAAIAARFANELTTGTSFADVGENEWYATYVSTAASFGWINGVGNGMYEPNRPITRTEAAAIINRMLFRISDWIEVDAGAGRQFPDVDENFWGRYEISEATNGHDHTLEEEYFHEDWISEDWREAVDNDPVNFGQPKY